MWLHHRVGVVRCGVRRVKLDRRRGICTGEVADGRVRLASEATGLRLGRRALAGREIERACRDLIVDINERSSGASLFECFGNHEGNSLMVVLNLGAAEQVGSVPVALVKLAGTIRSDNGENA